MIDFYELVHDLSHGLLKYMKICCRILFKKVCPIKYTTTILKYAKINICLDCEKFYLIVYLVVFLTN